MTRRLYTIAGFCRYAVEEGAAISTSAAVPPAEAELAGFCRARLAAYKVPVRWRFTSDFPLTTTGKVRKDVLSAQLAEVNSR